MRKKNKYELLAKLRQEYVYELELAINHVYIKCRFNVCLMRILCVFDACLICVSISEQIREGASTEEESTRVHKLDQSSLHRHLSLFSKQLQPTQIESFQNISYGYHRM